MRHERTANRYCPILAGCAFVLAGCSSGLLNSLERTADDPEIKEPVAESLVVENRVDVRWDEDPGADKYILERASDTASPFYGRIYQGTGTSYVDDDLDDLSQYLYRLVKVRGDREFGPSEAVLGVGGMIVRDAHEPNDEMSDATELTYDRVSNLYYFRSYEGHTVQDTDWYFVTVPPQYRAYVVVTQDGVSSHENTYFYFYQYGGPAATRITNEDAVTIENLTYSEEKFYFKVFPFGDDFVSDPSGAGGTVVNYTISLLRIEKL